MKLFKLLFAGVSSIAAVQSVAAHCPLCAAATAGGVGVTRFLGVDDTVVGTFIGGFVVSTGLWFNKWIRKKKSGKDFLPYQATIILLASLAFTVLTFYMAGLLGKDSSYLLFGVDKLVLGTVAGTAISLAAFALHKRIRAVKGRSFFPYQGIILTIGALTLTALTFYLVTLK